MLIIFSGYNQRAVISFLRTLKEKKVNRFVIFAASSNDSILHTLYAGKVFFVRKKKELDLQEICTALKRVQEEYQEEKNIIVPSTEALNRFMIKNREVLEKNNCIVPLVSERLYTCISDKDKFWNICKEHGLNVPRKVLFPDGFEFPVVAKPKQYISPNGMVYNPVFINSEDDWEKFIGQNDMEDFFLQEYVTGESFYLLYYFMKSGEVYKFSQQNYLQQLCGKSILAAECAEIHNQDISKQYEKLFAALQYTGFVMVEIRKNIRDYYMIEANPRFWGPSQLFCDAGYNFFELFLYEYGYLETLPEFKVDSRAKYFWGGAETYPVRTHVFGIRGGKGFYNAKKYMKDMISIKGKIR